MSYGFQATNRQSLFGKETLTKVSNLKPSKINYLISHVI